MTADAPTLVQRRCSPVAIRPMIAVIPRGRIIGTVIGTSIPGTIWSVIIPHAETAIIAVKPSATAAGYLNDIGDLVGSQVRNRWRSVRWSGRKHKTDGSDQGQSCKAHRDFLEVWAARDER